MHCDPRDTSSVTEKLKRIYINRIPRSRKSHVYDPFVSGKMSSSRNWEKNINSRSSEGLEDVEKRVKDVDITSREAKRVGMEHEAHDEAEKNHFPKVVKLDVGGHLFSTSLTTLTKDPGDLE